MNSLELNKESKLSPEQSAMEETQTTLQTVSEQTNEAVKDASADASPEVPAQESGSLDAEQVEVQQDMEVEKNLAATYAALDRAGLVDALRKIVSQEVTEVREDVELIKQFFYKKQKQELEEQKKAFLANEDAVESDFKPEKDNLEDMLKSLLGDFKAKKAAYAARLEQEKENNLLQKQHILEQMRMLTDSTDDVAAHIGEFKDLQQKWKTIGAVPATVSTDLWKQYNLLQEKFWDLIKINNELREYDFKKNLEAKLLLCEAAEKLLSEEDVVAAARQLQKLHEEWREIGPVAREMREEIWNRFKETTAEINRKHQNHFEKLRQGEEENLARKEALCEKLEAIDVNELKTYAAWDTATQTVKDLQEEWRTIGFAPRKSNQKVFERYRQACDEFFAKKSAFYKELKAESVENLEKKRALCEQAEALKDSTDWKNTTDKLVKIQSDWKKIGPVQKKYSDDLWKRFIAACDYFFEQKNKNFSNQRSEEQDNLKRKKEIVEKIEQIDATNVDAAHALLKELMEEFKNVGHVPFKDKDKIYKAYRAAVDKLFDALNLDANNRRLESFRTNLEDMSAKGEQKLYREREKLIRACEHLKSEIATYENNIGFFSSTSKKADSMLKEMERKIEGLKEECRLIEQKIGMIEEKL